MSTVIDFDHVHKGFTSWTDRPSDLKHLLNKLVKFKFDFGSKSKYQVLEDISFSIKSGEFVGIMGRNGAGKSTILKLVSGIYKPDKGQISIRGRIAPLLELGAGFSPDLTGYENIFLNSAILGFDRFKTQRSLESIIEFSELKDHIYKPVKNYSSGMLVRLGFSIATHMESEIMLFDEVLAVGDIWFQEKSLARIKEIYNEGRTVILVTHSVDQVKAYCNRCLIFGQKKLLHDGDVARGIEVYYGSDQ